MESTNNVVTANSNDDDDVQIVKIVDGDSDDRVAVAVAVAAITIQEFKHKTHSLSINASSVAACVGYHEFQSIPELMLKHIYQGRGGQRLLEHDAQLLGLKLTSRADEEAELLKLAESSGSQKVITAVTRALKVKHGDRIEQEKLRSVDDANVLKQTVAKELEADDNKLKQHNLTPHQLKLLKEGTRQAIDTGCGHSWEEEALDRYQEQCGWEVRERNAECRVWHFERTNGTDGDGDESDDDDEEDWTTSSNNSRNNSDNNNSNVPSIRPIAPAHARERVDHKAGSNVNDDNNNNNNNNKNQQQQQQQQQQQHRKQKQQR
jgi:hypothetical protein